MKIRIILLTFIALLIACKDEGRNIIAEALSTEVQKSEIATEIMAETIVSIKDIFLLLPDDVFPLEEISLANRKLLLKHIGEENAYAISATPIDIYDPKNGFLSLTGMQFGWEMSYWNLRDGRKLVAVNNGTETGSDIRVFFYHNGTLSEDRNYQLGAHQVYQLADFIDLEQLSPSTRKFAQQQFYKGDYSLYYQLPRQGTSLKIRLDIDQLLDYDQAYEVPYEATKEVVLKWSNETWER